MNVLRLFDNFVTKVENQDNGDIDVRSYKGLGTPMSFNEDSVTVGEENDGERGEADPCHVGLQWGFYKRC